MNTDDVHLPDDVHGSPMPQIPEPFESETLLPDRRSGARSRRRDRGRRRTDAIELGVDVPEAAEVPVRTALTEIPMLADAAAYDDGDEAGLEVSGLLAAWRTAVERPVRIDPSLAELLEHGVHRVDRSTIAAPTPHEESNVIDIAAARERGRVRRAVVRGGAVGIAAITVSGGLAAAGVLPAPVQRAVTSAAHVVGLEIDEPTRPSIGEATTTPTEAPVRPFTVPPRRATPANVATVPVAGASDSDAGTEPKPGTGNDGTSDSSNDRPGDVTDAPKPTTPPSGVGTDKPNDCTGDTCDPPPCQTIDPTTGEPIAPWKQRHKCKPCPTDRTSAPSGVNAAFGRGVRPRHHCRPDGRDSEKPHAHSAPADRDANKATDHEPKRDRDRVDHPRRAGDTVDHPKRTGSEHDDKKRSKRPKRSRGRG